jgi:hypothetical protein
MIIQGKSDQYKVQWEEFGIGSGTPVVSKKVEYVFFGIKLFSKWKVVWKGKWRYHPERMKPYTMREWFTKTVDEYEDYRSA